MTEPAITLPNGDVIADGDYAITRDGQKVGPINIPPKGSSWVKAIVADDQNGAAWYAGGRYFDTAPHSFDLIAKWHPAEAETVKPDYSDGNWWGWSGGECPVHPESDVVGVELTGTSWGAKASDNDWPSFRGRFSVITPYVEPAPAETVKPPKRRVWWIAKGQAFSSAREAKTAFPNCNPVKVKECRV